MPKTVKNKSQNKAQNTNDEKLFTDTNVSMKSGHLTKDVMMVSDGKFAKLRIAGNKQYLDNAGEIATITNYFNVLISQKLEEAFKLAQSLKKGDWVYVKGEDATKSFDTPEGYKQTASTIFAYKLVLKQAKTNAQSSKQAAPVPHPSVG